MNSTSIKRYEQEALSLFRTEVAPAFMFSKRCKNASKSNNRFDRVCDFCKYVHNELYVYDVFHVLFKCPLVAKERASMFQTLDRICGASEWERVDTLCDLGIILLSPQSIHIACVVGRFLSEYLAARDIVCASPPFCVPSSQIVSSKWLGGRSTKFSDLCTHISDALSRRQAALSPIPIDTCQFTNTWITWHSHESLDDAFKHVRSWLSNGWDTRLDKKSKSSKRSIACL